MHACHQLKQGQAQLRRTYIHRNQLQAAHTEVDPQQLPTHTAQQHLTAVTKRLPNQSSQQPSSSTGRGAIQELNSDSIPTGTHITSCRLRAVKISD